jgi:hypothetical protein
LLAIWAISLFAGAFLSGISSLLLLIILLVIIFQFIGFL